MYPYYSSRGFGALIVFVFDRLPFAAGFMARAALRGIGRWPGWSKVEYELRPPAGSGAGQH